jgi:hypothetical protein
VRGDDASFGDHSGFADLLGITELLAHVVFFAVVTVAERELPISMEVNPPA